MDQLFSHFKKESDASDLWKEFRSLFEKGQQWSNQVQELGRQTNAHGKAFDAGIIHRVEEQALEQSERFAGY